MDRIRRTRSPAPEPSSERRVTRTRIPQANEPYPIKWVKYKTSHCLYIGSVLFGIVGLSTQPHIGKKWSGQTHLPGVCGPVAFGDNPAVVMRDTKAKALEWLQKLHGEAPPPEGIPTITKVRRKK
jgi:hypothetical protein